MTFNSWPAKRHLDPGVYADFAAGKAAALAIYPGQTNFCFKAIYFNAAGKVLDVMDTTGHIVSINSVLGGYYIVDNYGVKTGGNTTAAQGDFTLLYD